MVTIIAVVCVIWWRKHEENGTIIYAIYVAVILLFLAVLITLEHAW